MLYHATYISEHVETESLLNTFDEAYNFLNSQIKEYKGYKAAYVVKIEDIHDPLGETVIAFREIK